MVFGGAEFCRIFGSPSIKEQLEHAFIAQQFISTSRRFSALFPFAPLVILKKSGRLRRQYSPPCTSLSFNVLNHIYIDSICERREVALFLLLKNGILIGFYKLF